MEEPLPEIKEAVTAGPADATGGVRPTGPAPHLPAGMEIMLGFELPVQISLARTSVPLREVLKLSTGSVLGLNRSLNDLADLVVNGRVIAQGEIVVVEGNYGIRICRVNDQARDAASRPEHHG